MLICMSNLKGSDLAMRSNTNNDNLYNTKPFHETNVSFFDKWMTCSDLEYTQQIAL